MLNDRSSSRAVEETLYTDGAAAAMREPLQVAGSQFRTLLQVIPELELTGRSLLDIGCGQGGFLAVADEQGWKVGGLEIDPVSAAACRQRGFDVAVGSIFDTPLPRGPWSVITFWDVLDHLDDPARALEMAYQELIPGGVVVVRGRNAAFHAPLKQAFARSQRVAAACRIPDISVVHRWGISPEGWRRLAAQAGFKAVRLHPAAMTPGDRYGSMGPGQVGSAMKRMMGGALDTAHRVSLGKVYPFPSVLLSGRKLETSG